MTLDFWQVTYPSVEHPIEEQRGKLYGFAKEYHNTRTGKELDTFENVVIAELVPKSNADLIGVASWRLKEKRNESSTPFILTKAHGDTNLTEERILAHEFDVAILTPRNNLHKPLAMASNWHGKAWDDAFVVLKRWLYSDLRIKVPDELSNTIYENHFIARGDIYRDYVAHCLSPAIDFVASDPVFMVDSGYAKRKRAQDVQEYTAKTGKLDWPIAPFILERLFSIWIERKGFKVIAL